MIDRVDGPEKALEILSKTICDELAYVNQANALLFSEQMEGGFGASDTGIRIELLSRSIGRELSEAGRKLESISDWLEAEVARIKEKQEIDSSLLVVK